MPKKPKIKYEERVFLLLRQARKVSRQLVPVERAESSDGRPSAVDVGLESVLAARLRVGLSGTAVVLALGDAVENVRLVASELINRWVHKADRRFSGGETLVVDQREHAGSDGRAEKEMSQQ